MIAIPQDGVLAVYKPVGPTSHDIINQVRRLTGVARVGHAGTLDPFAEGLLIVLIGREATKRQSEFLTMEKTYAPRIRFGARSTTDDCTGEIAANSMATPLEPLTVERAVLSFSGTFSQTPPQFSAKKIKGKKAYELARKGQPVALEPKKVYIKKIEILKYTWPYLTLRTTGSSGTYIRALARDIGEKLGCGAYCETLIRIRIGEYVLDTAIRLK
jgi:tRNA pseudouridine55 synthase